MVLQNKHKQQASKQYKKSHGIPLSSTIQTDRPRETGQERALRLGSNADRYDESDDDEEAGVGADGDPDEVDEELLAHKQAEAEALQDFLKKQQTKLASQPSNSKTSNDNDDDDVDASFSHLRIASTNKKGKLVMRDSEDAGELKGLEGEARRAQAIRDLKDRFTIPTPSPPVASSKSSHSSASRPANVRKPPPLPGMKTKEGGKVEEPKRGGEDFLDSLL